MAAAKKKKEEPLLDSVRAAALFDLFTQFYANPENEKAFQEWKAAKAAEAPPAAG